MKQAIRRMRPLRNDRLACSAVAVLALGLACQKSAPPAAAPPGVTVAEVIQRDVPITREWVGQVKGGSDVDIRARVPGFLLGIHFKEGTEVQKGQLLYTIDARELEDQVAAARAQLAEAQVRLTRAESDVRRYKPLAEINAVSQRDLETAVAEEGAAREQVEAARAALSLAETNLGYSRITAPISGVIGFSKAEIGAFVGQFPNPVVLNTVSRVDPIHVRFSISEREYLDLVRRFQNRQPDAPQERRTFDLILADGSVHPYPGVVNVLERQVDPTTGSLMIEAEFPNPEKVLRPGQYAKVRVVYENREGALLVPQRSVIDLQGQYFVYVVGADNTVENRAIQTGPRTGELWLVEHGLSAGEKVIVDGLQRVRPGMTVVPRPVESVNAPTTPPSSQPVGH